jgi:hypothetical protein
LSAGFIGDLSSRALSVARGRVIGHAGASAVKQAEEAGQVGLGIAVQPEVRLRLISPTALGGFLTVLLAAWSDYNSPRNIPRIPSRFMLRLVIVSAIALSVCPRLPAQDAPYFVTYDHHLEDQGDLEINVSSTVGVPRAQQRAYFAPYAEFEYGLRRWWTSSLYLEGQSTAGDSALFTGWRFENRFRPLAGEHIVNPVLYFEYENINEASRIQKEIVGTAPLLNEPNDELRQNHAHEIESKLILSSHVRSWNVSENFIVEKNLSAAEVFEFGYAVGASRPFTVHRRSFAAGLELYGGLGGTQGAFGFHETAQYAAPLIGWKIDKNSTVTFSPAVGLTGHSNPVLLRFGYSYEVEDFGRKVAALFR